MHKEQEQRKEGKKDICALVCECMFSYRCGIPLAEQQSDNTYTCNWVHINILHREIGHYTHKDE